LTALPSQGGRGSSGQHQDIRDASVRSGGG
jgi:hypothetical protein